MSVQTIELGWMRWTPMPVAVVLTQLETLASSTHPLERDDLVGMAGDPWDDAEIDQLMADADASDDPVEAADFRADAEQLRRRGRRFREFWPDAHTVADVVADLINRAVIVKRHGVWTIAPGVLPGDVLDLSDAERDIEDEFRYRTAFEGHSFSIIGLIERERPATFTTSVRQLARRLGIPSDSVRAALELLYDNGEFVADDDTSRIADDREFTLSIDWALFNELRVGIAPMT